MTGYVVFGTIRDAITALALSWKPELFPEHVTILEDGQVAVQADGFHQLERVANAHGVAVRPEKGRPKGRQMATIDFVVTEGWTHRDPLHFNADGTRRSSSEGHRFTATRPDYLVAARDSTEANRLLNGLLAHLSDGIEVTPIVASDADPFRYFWLISGNRPLLDVLQSAPRAWWGPVGHPSRAFIFVQWPFAIDLGATVRPHDPLQRLPWNAGQGFVLLSREKPKRLVIQVDPDRLRALPLEVFADLVPVPTARLRSDTAESDTRFPVSLRLRPSSPAEALAARMRRLEREIESRRVAIEALQAEQERVNAEEDVALVSAQPLLLFYSSDPAEVPDNLRRLLIEWTNQPGDLDALRCARFDAGTLPPGLHQAFRVVHIVTTARVLEGPAAPQERTLATRLHQYAPSEGEHPYFEQLDEWAPFGLHLFAPRGRTLELHPRLRPSKAAADKLARALSQQHGNADRSASLILLVGSHRDHPIACHVPIAGFRRLSEAFDWQCAVDVEIDQLVSETVSPPARDAQIRSLRQSFRDAIESESAAALAPVHEEMTERLRRSAELVQTYQQRLQQNAVNATQVEEQWGHVERHLGSLSKVVVEIENSLTGLSATLPRVADRVQAVRQAAIDLNNAREALARTRAQIEQLRK